MTFAARVAGAHGRAPFFVRSHVDDDHDTHADDHVGFDFEKRYWRERSVSG